MTEKNKQHPQVLLFADEDFIYGLNRPQTYYPDVKNQIDLGNLIVDNLLNSSKYKLDSNPIGDGSDLYIYNRYCGRYLKSTNSDLLITLIGDQNYAVKEALVCLGAKHIVIREESQNVNDRSVTVENNTGSKAVKVDASAHVSWNLSVDIKSQIEYINAENHPLSHDKIENFLCEHGLIGDTKLEMLLARLKERGSLSGTEKYEVSYLSEVKNAVDVSLAIKARIFNEKLDFDYQKTQKCSIKKMLEVTF